MKIFYLLKFAFYASIASYDYSINSKWTLAWSFLAILTIVLFLEQVIKDNKN